TLYKPATAEGAPDTFLTWVTPQQDPVTGKRTLAPGQRISPESGNDLLGQIDLTKFASGIYVLTLEVWGGSNPTPAVYSARFAMSTDLHLGRLTFSEEDLSTSAGGVPVHIGRSYDSSLGVATDFGGGWRLALDNFEPELD